MINKGLLYEKNIRHILTTSGFLPPALFGKLKQTENDAGFVHQNKEYFLELKNKSAPDYGARKIIYDPETDHWKWNELDDISILFGRLGVLGSIHFKPRKYVIPDHKLTEDDKRYDRRMFEEKVDLGLSGASILHTYYAKKDCFYIQIEGKGFYHLAEDRANLGVPQFIPAVVLRLRAKPHSSEPVHNYSFRVVITVSRRTFSPSEFDLEIPMNFPPLG